MIESPIAMVNCSWSPITSYRDFINQRNNVGILKVLGWFSSFFSVVSCLIKFTKLQ